MVPLITVHQDEAVRIATAGPLLIVVYAGQTHPSSLQFVDREEGRLAKQFGKFSLLSVVPITSSVFRVPAGVKEAAVALVDKYRDVLIADATVVPPRGITSAIVRTFLAGFSLIASRPYPSRVFSNLDEAIHWLAAAPGQNETLLDEIASVAEVAAFSGA